MVEYGRVAFGRRFTIEVLVAFGRRSTIGELVAFGWRLPLDSPLERSSDRRRSLDDELPLQSAFRGD